MGNRPELTRTQNGAMVHIHRSGGTCHIADVTANALERRGYIELDRSRRWRFTEKGNAWINA